MAANPQLTPAQVSLFLQDSPETNYLLDNVEFSADRIQLSINFALQEINIIPPQSSYTLFNFPQPAILLYGTLAYLFDGQAAFFARNSLPYNDGGVQINLEERREQYMALAQSFRETFQERVALFKQELNIESGFNWLPSDIGTFPYF